MRNDSKDTWYRASRSGIDPDDPGVRVVGVAERGMRLARERQVGGVPAGTGHLRPAVRPDELRARLLYRGHGCIQSSHGKSLSESDDRVVDDPWSGAATNSPVEPAGARS
jgi:hypothetical protein